MAKLIVTENDASRFARFLVREDRTGCLLFTGCKTLHGHGHFRLGKRMVMAHRVALTIAGYDVPDGFEVMHQCPCGDTPNCCEITHLSFGRHTDHARDRAHKGQGRKGSGQFPYGVFLQNNRYRTQVSVRGRKFYLGSYDSIEEAAAAAIAARDADRDHIKRSLP